MTDTRQYTIREIAAAMDLNPSSVKRRAARESWPFEEATGRGGKRRLFALSSLPEDVQRALVIAAARSGEADAVEQPADAQDNRSRTAHEYDRDSLWAYYERKPEKQKAIAKEKLKVFVALEALLASGCNKQQALREVAEGTPWSWRTIRDIYYGKPGRPGLRHYDRADWLAALVPGYVGRTRQATLSPEAWEFIKSDYLRPEAPSFNACYARLQVAAREHGWKIPSARTLRRRIDALPLWLKVLKRKGEHAMLQLYPPMQRSVRELHAMEWINGDGYKHNVFVKLNPDDPNEKPFRPKTWFWQDVYSRKILAWATDETENSDMIRLALGRVIEQYGIPEHATIDNTPAAANKWLTGSVPNRYRFKVKPEDPVGLFPALGVQVHWTTVQAGKGHGQAKPVERSFGIGGIGEYVDKHPRLAGAYTGANPMAKPDNYGERAVSLETFQKALAEGVAMWNAMRGRQTEMAGGVLSFDEVFEQSYSRSVIRKATESQQRLWMLTAESVRVAKDGSITLDA
ncbi:MAG: DNA-binding protein, partial [Gammaproteobacteria bacterium]